MIKSIFSKKAQSMVEYAVIIAVVASALVAVGIVFKCALQKKIRDTALELSSTPYAPERTTAQSTATTTISSTETYDSGVTNVSFNETTTRSGTTQVQPETQ